MVHWCMYGESRKIIQLPRTFTYKLEKLFKTVFSNVNVWQNTLWILLKLKIPRSTLQKFCFRDIRGSTESRAYFLFFSKHHKKFWERQLTDDTLKYTIGRNNFFPQIKQSLSCFYIYEILCWFWSVTKLLNI